MFITMKLFRKIARKKYHQVYQTLLCNDHYVYEYTYRYNKYFAFGAAVYIRSTTITEFT